MAKTQQPKQFTIMSLLEAFELLYFVAGLLALFAILTR